MHKQFQRQQLQKRTDQLAYMKSSLYELQKKIDNVETSYLSRTWHDGNILIGWKKESSSSIPANCPHIEISPKDKIFSLSSATSPVNFELTSISNIADKNLTPFYWQRFRRRQPRNRSEQMSYKKRVSEQGKCERKKSMQKLRNHDHRIQRSQNKKKYDFRKIRPVSDYKNFQKQ